MEFPRMGPDTLTDPVAWLRICGFGVSEAIGLDEYLQWWRDQGLSLSQSVDRAGTPWLKRYDVQGNAVDQIVFSAEYRRLLCKGYEAGIVWRAFDTGSLMPFFSLGYVTAFHDSGLYCPYTLSMATALTLQKRGEPLIKARFLPP